MEEDTSLSRNVSGDLSITGHTIYCTELVPNICLRFLLSVKRWQIVYFARHCPEMFSESECAVLILPQRLYNSHGRRQIPTPMLRSIPLRYLWEFFNLIPWFFFFVVGSVASCLFLKNIVFYSNSGPNINSEHFGAVCDHNEEALCKV